jgi:hypothetical protein
MRDGKAMEITVRLASHEWDGRLSLPGINGNGTLYDVAVEQFLNEPDLDLVRVIEHAGWYLAFGRVNPGTFPPPHHTVTIGCVESPNSAVKDTSFHFVFWQRFNTYQWVTLPTINH